METKNLSDVSLQLDLILANFQKAVKAYTLQARALERIATMKYLSEDAMRWIAKEAMSEANKILNPHLYESNDVNNPDVDNCLPHQ